MSTMNFQNSLPSPTKAEVSIVSSQNSLPSPTQKIETPNSSCKTSPHLGIRTPESVVSDSISEVSSLQRTPSSINFDTSLNTFVPNYNLENEKRLRTLIRKKLLQPNVEKAFLRLYSRENQKLLQQILKVKQEIYKKNSIYDNLLVNLSEKKQKSTKKPNTSQNNSTSSVPKTICACFKTDDEILSFYINERERLANRLGALRKKLYELDKSIKRAKVSDETTDSDALLNHFMLVPQQQTLQEVDFNDLFYKFVSLEPLNIN